MAAVDFQDVSKVDHLGSAFRFARKHSGSVVYFNGGYFVKR